MQKSSKQHVCMNFLNTELKLMLREGSLKCNFLALDYYWLGSILTCGGRNTKNNNNLSELGYRSTNMHAYTATCTHLYVSVNIHESWSKILGGEVIYVHSKLQSGLLPLDFGSQKSKTNIHQTSLGGSLKQGLLYGCPTRKTKASLENNIALFTEHMQGTWRDRLCRSTELPLIN